METHKIPGNLHMLRIFPKTLEPTIGRPAIEVASSDPEEIQQWKKEIEAVCVLIETQQRDQHRQELIMKKKAQSKKIALEMSNLVTYCRPVHFQFEREQISLCDTDFVLLMNRAPLPSYSTSNSNDLQTSVYIMYGMMHCLKSCDISIA